MTRDDALDIKKPIIAIVVIFLLLFVVLSSAKGVGAGQRGILLTWGKVDPNILDEGLHFVIPIAQNIVVMTVQTQLYQSDASAASKDLQDVSTKVAVNYHIDSGRVAEIYQKYTTSYEPNIIQPAVQESVKASTALFTAEQLITERPAVKEKIEASLRARLANYGILLEAVSITDFQFTAQFSKAIEAKVTAVQEALQAENELRKIEVEAQQEIAHAYGKANATLTQAIAEAQAIKIRGDALRSNPELVQLEAVQKWDGVLPVNMYGSAPVPFINIAAIG